jgi:hypothetical protein
VFRAPRCNGSSDIVLPMSPHEEIDRDDDRQHERAGNEEERPRDAEGIFISITKVSPKIRWWAPFDFRCLELTLDTPLAGRLKKSSACSAERLSRHYSSSLVL